MAENQHCQPLHQQRGRILLQDNGRLQTNLGAPSRRNFVFSPAAVQRASNVLISSGRVNRSDPRGFHVANRVGPMGRNSFVGYLAGDWGELPIPRSGIQGLWLAAMKTYLLSQGLYTEDSIDTDPVAGRIVMERALELASMDGRSAIELSANDWQQAKRELTGETE